MKRKILIGTGVFVFIVVVVILNLRRGGDAKDVEGQVVKTGKVVSEVRVEGTLEAENQVEIGSEVMGKIVTIRVKEGDRVKKGDLLCIIDPSTYEARLAQANARLRVSKAKLQKAELDMRRSSQLLEEKLISDEEHERMDTEYESMKAQVEVDQSAVREALQDLNKTTLRSPIGGEVVNVAREEGEMVIMGTIGTPGSVIMTIAERSKMFVKAIVDETEIVKVRIGQKAETEVDAFPDTTFPGEVVRIGGVPVTGVGGSEQAVNFPVEVELRSGTSELYPGMSATCNIRVAEKDSALLVPYTALGKRKIDEEEKDVLFLAEGDAARLKPVSIGVTGEKEAEIEEGVNLGDTVLVGPYKTLKDLKDGDKVKIEFKEETTDADRGKGADQGL